MNLNYSENKTFIEKICKTLNCKNVGYSPTTRERTTIDYCFSQVINPEVSAFYIPWSHHYISLISWNLEPLYLGATVFSGLISHSVLAFSYRRHT